MKIGFLTSVFTPMCNSVSNTGYTYSPFVKALISPVPALYVCVPVSLPFGNKSVFVNVYTESSPFLAI